MSEDARDLFTRHWLFHRDAATENRETGTRNCGGCIQTTFVGHALLEFSLIRENARFIASDHVEMKKIII